MFINRVNGHTEKFVERLRQKLDPAVAPFGQPLCEWRKPADVHECHSAEFLAQVRHLAQFSKRRAARKVWDKRFEVLSARRVAMQFLRRAGLVQAQGASSSSSSSSSSAAAVSATTTTIASR